MLASRTHLQAFMKVYEQLREEILQDEVVKDMPESSVAWMKRVRQGQGLRMGTDTPSAPWIHAAL